MSGARRSCIVRGDGRFATRRESGMENGEETMVRGIYGPDVTFLGVPRV